MASDLVLGGTTFAKPVAQFMDAAGTFWDSYRVSPAEYEVQEIPASDVNGVARGRLGFRRQLLWCAVWYIGASEQACNNAYRSDREAFDNANLAITIPDDEAWAVADLIPGASNPSGPPKPCSNAAGTFRLRVEYMFQRRDTT